MFSLKYSLPRAIAENLIAPFSAALTGWGLGITIAEIIHLNLKSVLFGLLLTLIMFVFTMLPVWLSMQVIAMAQDVRSKWFVKKQAVLAVNLMALAFFVLGLAGLWQQYGS